METPSLNYLKNLSGGNKVFERKIFKIFQDELPQEFSSYQQAIDSKNYYYAAEIVHKMKHKIAFFEMEKAFNVVEKHENALRKGKLNNQGEIQDIVTKLLKFLPECPE